MFRAAILFVASLAAALVVAAGMSLAGFAPSPTTPAAQVADVGATQAPADPPVKVHTVYLTPTQPPKRITVTKVHTTTASHGGDDGGEHGGGDD
jgi:hypothetical protein